MPRTQLLLQLASGHSGQLRRAYTCRIAPQPVRFLGPQGTPHGPSQIRLVHWTGHKRQGAPERARFESARTLGCTKDQRCRLRVPDISFRATVMDHVCFGNLAASKVRCHWRLGPCTRRTNVPLCPSGSGLPLAVPARGLELGLIMIIGARHVQPGPCQTVFASDSELRTSQPRPNPAAEGTVSV